MLEEGQRLPTSAVNENVQGQRHNLTQVLNEAKEKFKADAEIALKQREHLNSTGNKLWFSESACKWRRK